MTPVLLKAPSLPQLPSLPYAQDALTPVISPELINYHYEKYHRGYFDTLSKMIVGTEFESLPLERIITETAHRGDKISIFNSASEAWNHAFYWRSLTSRGSREPSLVLRKEIESSFGTLDACKKELAFTATARHGNGWVWLVKDRDKLKAIKTDSAESPLVMNVKPLLTIDLWVHAYYMDYQYRCRDYVRAVLDKLIHWDFVEGNYWKEGIYGKGRDGRSSVEMGLAV